MTVKDFDTPRKQALAERGAAQFLLGGYTFTIKRKIPPEVLADWARMKDMDDANGLAYLDNVMHDVLIMEDHSEYERQRSIREPDEDILDVNDLLAVMEWVLEEVTGRPFELSSGSGTPPAPETDGTSPTEKRLVSLPPSSTPAVS